jgi:membrane protease YdiL (CAAX protease family)
MPSGFQLAQHPWLSLLIIIMAEAIAMIIFMVVVVGVFKRPRDAPMTGFISGTLAHITVLFLLVPFALGLPEGTRSFKAYVDAIRLSQVQPFTQLLLLGLSSYLILAFCQISGVLVYRAFQRKPISGEFIHTAFSLASDSPLKSWGWLVPIPSIFEEVAFRGVVLSLFLTKYSEPYAILFTALGFGASHLFNLLSGKKPVWVLGQVVWAAILGLFYGTIVLKSNSLFPAMLFHYLSNLFVGPLTSYLQKSGSIKAQAVYGVLFSFGLIPTTLMILWVVMFTTLWPISH